jgi:transposase
MGVERNLRTVGRRGPKAGDVLRIPVDDDRVAYGRCFRPRNFCTSSCSTVCTMRTQSTIWTRTGALKRELVAAGERLLRVPPKLTAPERRAGRARGKSDSIGALAAARASLREPRLDRPRAGEERLRELKLLVFHRDDLVDERRRAQQRLRWHMHELDSTLAVAPGALDRAVQLERVSRWLARREQTVLVRIARDLVGRCRSLTRAIIELEGELAAMTAQIAPALLELPGCGALTAAKLLAEIGPIERFQTDAQLARHGDVAPLEASSGRVRRHRLDVVATASSTARCTGSRLPKARPSRRSPLPGTHAGRRQTPSRSRSAASNVSSRASSSTHSKRAQS